jgi:hypothetical protein
MPEPRWTIGTRLAAGATVASAITFAFLLYLLPLMAFLGALVALWAGVGIIRGMLQGAAFGLGAAATGWLLTFLRYALNPELMERTRDAARRP